MERRPIFREIKSFEEFTKYYWYKDELNQICKDLGIACSGVKADLYLNIQEYFLEELIKKEIFKKHSKVQSKIESNQLSLDMSLLKCGFCFNKKFRDFFSIQT